MVSYLHGSPSCRGLAPGTSSPWPAGPAGLQNQDSDCPLEIALLWTPPRGRCPFFLPDMETVSMCPGNANATEQSSSPLKHGSHRTSQPQKGRQQHLQIAKHLCLYNGNHCRTTDKRGPGRHHQLKQPPPKSPDRAFQNRPGAVPHPSAATSVRLAAPTPPLVPRLPPWASALSSALTASPDIPRHSPNTPLTLP